MRKSYFNNVIREAISLIFLNLLLITFSSTICCAGTDLVGVNEGDFMVTVKAGDEFSVGDEVEVVGLFRFTGPMGMIVKDDIDSKCRVHRRYFYLSEPVHDMVAGFLVDGLPMKATLRIEEVGLYGYAYKAETVDSVILNDLFQDMVDRVRPEMVLPAVEENWCELTKRDLGEISVERYAKMTSDYQLPVDGYDQVGFFKLFSYIPDKGLLIFEGKGAKLPPFDDPQITRWLMLYPVFNIGEDKVVSIIYTIQGEFYE
ncbi:MAG: hypothetical protein B6D57_04245 [Candidatus Coatesbacteria bacterium 4484_99]|uniref:Uncharacterized protein n=1 Tax=Candidatus Coatesbacteria bacterium 4484_99 TaxID=1970774 RepID=A0A1W9S053_9BACT|nr:MAG: hypothetical protein B6D57_04245 [Candidatus Coatesbacteria bacterium 4484_99]